MAGGVAGARFPLCLSGGGLLWAWSFLFFFAGQAEAVNVPSFWLGDVVYLGSTLVSAFCAIAFSQSLQQPRILFKVALGACVCLEAGTALMGVSSALGETAGPLFLVGRLFAGPGQGILWILWLIVLTRFDIEFVEKAFLVWLPLLALALGILCVLFFVPQPQSHIAVFALSLGLPVLSVRLLAVSLEKMPSFDQGDHDVDGDGILPAAEQDVSVLRRSWLKRVLPPKNTLLNIANIGLTLAIVMFAWTAFLFCRPIGFVTPKIVFALGALGVFVIMAISLHVTRSFGVGLLYRWALPLMALATASDQLLGMSGALLTCFCLAVVSVGFECIFRLLFVYLAKRDPRQTVSVIALGSASMALGGLLGSGVWAWASSALAVDVLERAPLITLTLFVFAACALPAEGRAARQEGEGELPLADPEESDGSLTLRCASIAEDYGLTAREQEILYLLAQGRSRTYIRETLFISKGTVDTHVHHIYSKIGIRSKDALMSFVVDGCS